MFNSYAIDLDEWKENVATANRLDKEISETLATLHDLLNKRMMVNPKFPRQYSELKEKISNLSMKEIEVFVPTQIKWANVTRQKGKTQKARLITFNLFIKNDFDYAKTIKPASETLNIIYDTDEFSEDDINNAYSSLWKVTDTSYDKLL